MRPSGKNKCPEDSKLTPHWRHESCLPRSFPQAISCSRPLCGLGLYPTFSCFLRQFWLPVPYMPLISVVLSPPSSWIVGWLYRALNVGRGGPGRWLINSAQEPLFCNAPWPLVLRCWRQWSGPSSLTKLSHFFFLSPTGLALLTSYPGHRQHRSLPWQV